MACRYPELVAVSVQGYESHLRRVLSNVSNPSLRDAVDRLLHTITAAQQFGVNLPANNVTFTTDALEHLTEMQRGMLLNQFALGLGRDDALVLVIGTEAAYDIARDEDLPNFAVESCGSAILWLCDGSADITQTLSGGAMEVRRPFHLYPNDYYQEGGGHTWGRLAQVLGNGVEHACGADPALGDLCYQIELSAHPRQVNRDGIPPTPQRIAFLTTVVRTLSATATRLLFHGRANDENLQPAVQALSRVFLDVQEGEPIAWQDIGERNRPVVYAERGERRVVRTRALAGQGVTAGFIQQLRTLLAQP